MRKKITILIAFVVMTTISAFCQLKETFDSNSWQWTECSTVLGKAYIIDGVMRLESKSDYGITNLTDIEANIATHSFIPMDPVKGFVIKCVAKVEWFDKKKQFGIILDYIDDMNCLIFMIKGDYAYLYKVGSIN